jgi:hypothetical protein
LLCLAIPAEVVEMTKQPVYKLSIAPTCNPTTITITTLCSSMTSPGPCLYQNYCCSTTCITIYPNKEVCTCDQLIINAIGYVNQTTSYDLLFTAIVRGTEQQLLCTPTTCAMNVVETFVIGGSYSFWYTSSQFSFEEKDTGLFANIKAGDWGITIFIIIILNLVAFGLVFVGQIYMEEEENKNPHISFSGFTFYE